MNKLKQLQIELQNFQDKWTWFMTDEIRKYESKIKQKDKEIDYLHEKLIILEKELEQIKKMKVGVRV